MDEKTKSLIGLQISAICLSLVGVVSKLISQSSVIMVFVRSVFAAISLFLFLKVNKEKVLLQTRKDYLGLFLSGLLFALHIFFFFESVKASSVFIALAAIFTYPLMLAFLEPYFFHCRLSKSSILLALLAFLGVLIMVPEFELSNRTTQGVIYGVIAAGIFSINVIINKSYFKKYSETLVISYQNLTAALLLLPIFLIEQPIISTNDLSWLFFMGVILNLGGYILFYKSLRHVKAQTAGIISSVEPVYGLISAFLILGEVPVLKTILGGLLIVIASLAATLNSKSQVEPP
ncbi:EamA family transporter [Candidatus Micrarchaeota archaeon]|nr:EamA family transporter [Candidatus Micrarchaeota archaeon]